MIGTVQKKPGKPRSVALRLGTNTSSPAVLIARIERGLPIADLESLQHDLGIPLDALAAHLGIARATLHRRKQSGRLTVDESDKVVRFARLLRLATDTFGDLPTARKWLATPQPGLG